MVDVALGKHRVVLEGGLAEGGAVGGDENELGLAGTEVLEGGLVAEGGLSGLHDELETRVGVLGVLLGFLRGRGHLDLLVCLFGDYKAPDLRRSQLWIGKWEG